MSDLIHDAANFLHIGIILGILAKIWFHQSCIGLSGKSQILYALVFTTRYLDLFSTFISLENSIFKILYITTGYFTVASVFLFFRTTYEKKYDTFSILRLLIPCLVISLFVNYQLEAVEVLWMFSICLEAVAIVPQFHFVSEAKHIRKHVLYYIACLSVYKSLYILHWIYRYYFRGFYDPYSQAAGVVQCFIILDFFVRVLPHLEIKKSMEEEIIYDNVDDNRDYVDTIEKGCTSEKSGYLGQNVSTIILTPASLVMNNDKENILKGEQNP